MTRPVLYLIHGWSYDASFWAPLLACLPKWRALCADAGYFGAPNTPPLPTEPWIGVSHSAGLLEFLERTPFKETVPNSSGPCKGLIAFNGFARFTTAPDFPSGVPERVLTRMERQLEKAPLSVLMQFRALCGEQAPQFPGAPESARLRVGLERLRTRDCRAEAARLMAEGRLFGLAGNDDPLAPAQIGLGSNNPNLLIGRPPSKVTRSVGLVEGGHLLPLTQSRFCADWLEQIWETALTPEVAHV